MTDLYAPVLGEGYDVARLFEASSPTLWRETLATLTLKRLTLSTGTGAEAKLDIFADNGFSCCFLRFTAGRARQIGVTFRGAYRVTTCASGGWLLQPMQDDLDSYWVPQAPTFRRLDNQGHVLEERRVQFSGVSVSTRELALQANMPDGWVTDWTLWRFPRAAKSVINELSGLLPVEAQGFFLWGSHALYKRPADVYLHLIHGHVYDNRFNWPKYWKICSENDAHALYTVLSGLELASGKRLYRLLKEQLLLSVLARQGEDGGWRHGEWTARMESHYRLHCSAMHMLMDALTEQEDPAVRTALERAAGFLALQTDRVGSGAWFLHDELEHSSETLGEGPFNWVSSRAFGKAEANMLVLNSHLDATVALDRYRQVTGDPRHKALVDQAVSATRTVLSLQPADWLYKPLFQAIRLTFLPTEQAARLPLHLRILKRVAWKYLIPLLPDIKAYWPRIVMPGGYIDRELSLRLFAHEYLPINLTDLLRYWRRFPGESIDSAIVDAIALISDYRMFERWPEIKGKEYAVGFWAEALYHACLVYPDAEYRASLAQTVIALQRLELGLPPSLLGANSEAVSPPDHVPSPVPDDSRIRVVNLSRRDTLEVLLINCASETVSPRILRNAPAGITWALGGDAGSTSRLPNEIPVGGWLWGRSRNMADAPA